MKSKLYRTLLFCVGSALVGATAFAQADATTQPSGTPQGGTSSQIGTPTGRDTGHFGLMHARPIRASKVTGSQVKSASGETLGTIEDIIFNPRTGQAEFAVLALTGATATTTAGAGEKLVPVPWKVLSPSSTPPQPGAAGSEQCTFTANIDSTKLASAPSFDKNQWPDWSQRDWNQKVYSYFGMTPETGTGGTGSGLEKGGAGPGTEKGSGAGGLQPKSDTR